MRFRSLRGRILFYFLSLLTLVQLAGFWTFDVAMTQGTRNRIGEQLAIGAGAFSRLIDERTDVLVLANRILSSDFAFKQAFFASLETDDTETIHWLLKNHQNRIGADLMMLISLDGDIIADTADSRRRGKYFEFPEMLRNAEEEGSESQIVFYSGHAYQMAVVPLLAPEPEAWICAGFVVDDTLAKDLRSISLAHISFIRLAENKPPEILATTLDAEVAASLPGAAAGMEWKTGTSFSMRPVREEFVSFLVPLGGDDGVGIKVLLQRSMRKEMAPFRKLRAVLAALFVFSVMGTAAGGALLAASVTKPVRILAEGARRIRAGDYGRNVEIKQQDEIGHLAETFNDMTRGLADRDRVRDLLGKVVSPEIAAELLEKGVELGGEEREVTILFSDIRGFTSISEKLPPRKVLDILNRYLTRMNDIIEKNSGVVDKFIGDSVMALFGAPVPIDSHADAAMKTALEMQESLRDLNREFTAEGIPEIRIGIGINTAVVVTGNMGSRSRLNYSVIGDGVNVASRLENLTKNPEFAAGIIVSKSVLAAAKSEYATRHLGEVTVKGKSEKTSIYSLEKQISL